MSNPMHSSLAKGLQHPEGWLSLLCWAVHCHCCVEETLDMESVLPEIKPACDVQGTGIKWLTT